MGPPWVRARFLPRPPGHAPCLLPLSHAYRPGDSRSPAAGSRSQTETAAAEVERLRSLVLDHPAASVATLGRRSGPGQTGDGSRLASGRLPLVLALAVPAAQRTAQDQRRDTDAHLAD